MSWFKGKDNLGSVAKGDHALRQAKVRAVINPTKVNGSGGKHRKPDTNSKGMGKGDN